MDDFTLQCRIRDAAAYRMTDGQQQAALYLFRDLLAAAGDYGVTLEHFDATGADLALVVVGVIRARSF
ncbi:hypothetical protein ACIQU6_41605 [Streptomyces sp. NPDC090442]|uniref:hypothetical protein n=1 Tax=Streptomyces sp. NPDC090442 TaxID=3365962 RepID=UPI00380661FD